MWRDKRVTQRQPPGVHLHNLVDAPTRRVHFRAQRAIGRALVEAQTAVHAARIQLPRRLLVRREVRVRASRLSSAQCSKDRPPAQNVLRIERLLHRAHAGKVGRFARTRDSPSLRL